jgi:hypothetical protein
LIQRDTPLPEFEAHPGKADTPVPWAVVGASAPGTSHLGRAVPCQDAHICVADAGGTLVVAVADGAGSAARAERGALAAVARATESLAGSAPDADGMREAFRAAREALEALAAAEGLEPRDLACTLTCVHASGHTLVAGQVGDGLAVVRRPDGVIEAVTHPQRGEYANEASFLTGPGALATIEIAVVDAKVDAIAVVTDGLLRLAADLSTGEPHGPFFLPLWDFVTRADDMDVAQRRLAAFLASDRVNARTDDDKTLVLAVRRTACPSDEGTTAP